MTFGASIEGDARSVLSRAEDVSCGDGGALQEAIDFLVDLLAGGPVASKQCLAAARDAGIAKRTLERAKRKLNVQSRKPTTAGGWVWSLTESRSE